MLEKTVENYLSKEVKKLGGMCLKWVSPSVRGVPDRIVLFPTGHVSFVETKQPNGTLRKQQELRHHQFSRLGFEVSTLYSKDDVDKYISQYKNCVMKQYYECDPKGDVMNDL